RPGRSLANENIGGAGGYKAHVRRSSNNERIAAERECVTEAISIIRRRGVHNLLKRPLPCAADVDKGCTTQGQVARIVIWTTNHQRVAADSHGATKQESLGLGVQQFLLLKPAAVAMHVNVSG